MLNSLSTKVDDNITGQVWTKSVKCQFSKDTKSWCTYIFYHFSQNLKFNEANQIIRHSLEKMS